MVKTTTTTTSTATTSTPTKRVSRNKAADLPAVPETTVPVVVQVSVPETTVPVVVPETPVKRSTRKVKASVPEVTPTEVVVEVSVPTNDTPNLEVSSESDTLILGVSGMSRNDILAVVSGLQDVEKQLTASRVAIRNLLRGFDRMSKEHSKVTAKLNTVTNERNELKKSLTELQVNSRKLKAEKKAARKLNNDGKVVVRGFDRNCELSSALCTFMGLPAGSQKSRNEVMRVIRSYIKDNNLKSQEDRRGWQFIPDTKLGLLLGEAKFPLKNSKKEADRILDLGYSHFNIQSYLNQHILKTVPLTEQPTA